MKSTAAALIALAVQGPLRAGPIYHVVDLGAAASVSGISSTGYVAGSRLDAAGQSRAFITDGNNAADLSTALSMAAAVNGSGQVAGTYWTASGAQAATWDGGVATDLGTLGGPDSYATALNNLGQVTGNSTNNSGDGHAFLYHNGVMQDLGTPAGAFWSSAYSINDAGVIAGYSLAPGGVFRGFRWTAGDGFLPIGALGGATSYAMAVSSTGAIAGHAQNAAGMLHAFLYDGNVLTDLGTLGGWQSFAYGVNASNSVVGYSLLAGGEPGAFLYSGGILYDLNTLISASGWNLTEARAINDLGQIAGTGLFDGQLHAFRLDPIRTVENPEPATWLLAGGALLLFAFSLCRSV